MKDEKERAQVCGNLIRRKKGNEEEYGTFHPAEDGKPVPDGADLIYLGKAEEDGWRDVTVLHSRRSGPAQVATRKYCDGHERIFGSKKVGIA